MFIVGILCEKVRFCVVVWLPKWILLGFFQANDSYSTQKDDFHGHPPSFGGPYKDAANNSGQIDEWQRILLYKTKEHMFIFEILHEMVTWQGLAQ